MSPIPGHPIPPIAPPTGTSPPPSLPPRDDAKRAFFDRAGWNLLALVVYRAALDAVYEHAVQPIFEYTGMFNDATPASRPFSWAVLLASTPFVLRLLKRPSPGDTICVLLHLAAFVPATCLMAYMPPAPGMTAGLLAYWGVFLAAAVFLPRPRLPRLSEKSGRLITQAILAVAILGTVYISGRYTGFRFTLDLSMVYDLRFEARELGMSSIERYLFLGTRTILPTAIVCLLYGGHRFLALAAGFCLLLSFSVDGMKSALFMTLLAFLGYAFYRARRAYLFAWALTAMELAAWAEYAFWGSLNGIAYFVHRVLLLPAQINYYYYDFAARNGPHFFRDGVGARLGFPSPYALEIPSIIGREYFRSNHTSANNGLFSDAYLNLGFVGCLFMPLLVVFALRALDACSDGIPSRLMIAAIAFSTILFMSNPFTVSLLTNAFPVLCLLLYALPRQDRDRPRQGAGGG